MLRKVKNPQDVKLREKLTMLKIESNICHLVIQVFLSKRSLKNPGLL